MRRVFFFGVIAYSVLILLLNDLPYATSYTGTAAMPFMLKCLVDISFAAFAAFKIFGSQIHWDEDEVGIHEDDIKLPDAWFYGLFGLNLLGNFGWHVQLQLDGRTLPDREPLLKKLSGTLVVDHVGKFLEPVAIDHPGFKVLLRLLENGRTWVKLSAPYEWSKAGPPNYTDVGQLAYTLSRAAPDRMLWATNWPHPTPGLPKPDDAWLLDMLLEWVPDEATRTKTLVDNPARLYGF